MLYFMNESENAKTIKDLEKALEKQKAANDKLKDKHKADTAKIRNLKRRKDPKPTPSKKNSPDLKLTEEQISKIVEILRGTDTPKK